MLWVTAGVVGVVMRQVVVGVTARGVIVVWDVLGVVGVKDGVSDECNSSSGSRRTRVN